MIRCKAALKIIAEIGLNHLGDAETARRMLDDALAAGVDGVTFQVRESSFYDASRAHRRDLSDAFYAEMVERAARADRPVGLAIADAERVSALDRRGVCFWKSLSWDIRNPALQAALRTTGKPVWVSTGVSPMEEIVAASAELENGGFIHTQLTPEVDETNLLAIDSMRAATARPVAFGLHCPLHEVLIAALGLRPAALFFYVRDGDEKTYPDHAHALLLADLPRWVAVLRQLETALGTGEKKRIERKL